MDASRYDLVALRAVLEPPVLGFADLHTHCDLDLVCPACLGRGLPSPTLDGTKRALMGCGP